MAQPNYSCLANAFAAAGTEFVTASQEYALLSNVPAVNQDQTLIDLVNHNHNHTIQETTAL